MASGRFDAYAVTTRSGPHVTLQAGVLHGGRHWTTARRDSVKAASVNRVGRASATIGGGARWRMLGGVALSLDPAHPSTFASHLCSSTLAGGAVLRLGLGRLDQLLGYAEAGDAVPISFLPTGRVLLVTRVRDELIVESDDVMLTKGRWARRPAALEPARRPKRRWRPDQVLAGLPGQITALATRPGPAWFGVETSAGAVALPAEWDADTGRLRVGRSPLAVVAAELPGPVCVTLHDSGSRRPDEKFGVMLRGTGAIVDMDPTSVSVAVDVDRVTYWCGFATTTVGRAA